MILYSPAEPASVVRSLERQSTLRGIVVASSPLPESMGVDFCWRSHERWWGLQRKELNDFIASLNDGRLTREVAQMRAGVVMPMLAIEGRVQVANDIVVTRHAGSQLSLSGLHKRVLTLQSRGIQVLWTPDSSTTIHLVVDAYQWSQKDGHTTARSMPKPTGDWGQPTNKEFQVHLLASLPGVGWKRAEAIIDGLGRCPLKLDATVEELMGVDGIGKVTAERIVRCLDNG